MASFEIIKTCSGCGREEDDLKECTGCRVVQYCGRSCQKAHWKGGHKSTCLQHKYLQKWSTQVNVIGTIFRKHIPSDRLDELRGSTEEVVVLDVDFDFNEVTFLPTQKPRTALLDEIKTLSSSQKQTFCKKITELKSVVEANGGNAPLGVALLYRGIGEIFVHPGKWSRKMEPDDTVEETMAFLQKYFYMRMPEIKKPSWYNLLSRNVDVQTTAFMDKDIFIKFLGNALRLGAAPAVQRHTTHVVQINLKFGKGLGEIQQLESFEVKPVEEVKNRLPSGTTWSGNGRTSMTLVDSPDILRQDQAASLNLVDSPDLLRHRAVTNCPSLAMFTVIFNKRPVFMMKSAFYDVALWENEAGVESVEAWDERAHHYFTELQQVSLPPVPSPAVA
ncbi:MAG: hypothetical protein SGILL_009165 [Bacillariaceae sp.]